MSNLATPPSDAAVQRLSIVIPVYQGEKTLRRLIDEIAPFTSEQTLASGERWRVSEVILVHDCGPDRSDEAMKELASEHGFVKVIWLTRNFGQHPATLAGMASSTGDWVVSMDEDGQQDPRDIPSLLEAARTERLQLVYARARNPPPHGFVRNALSTGAKRVASYLLRNDGVQQFNSFRLIDGEIARSLAAYCGSGVYLDVALFWITNKVGQGLVTLRPEMDRPSGYSLRKLLKHFWQLILTSGTRPLRLITVLGFCSLMLAMAISAYALWVKFHLEVPIQGWTSLVIVVAFFSGAIITSLGVIAEYLAVTMSIVMGRPLYMVGTKPAPGSRARSTRSTPIT
jgi:undecaprenyl-phosphate 4-deoxy-4-formamido-L-arabinose transferase